MNEFDWMNTPDRTETIQSINYVCIVRFQEFDDPVQPLEVVQEWLQEGQAAIFLKNGSVLFGSSNNVASDSERFRASNIRFEMAVSLENSIVVSDEAQSSNWVISAEECNGQRMRCFGVNDTTKYSIFWGENREEVMNGLIMFQMGVHESHVQKLQKQN